MSKAEKFIQLNTKTYSNETRITIGRNSHWEKQPWLSPEQALRAVEIARKELIERACEWLSNVSMEDMTYKYDDFSTSEKWYEFINDFKNYIKGE